MRLSKIRKIIHVDMDAFFAAVEMRDNPEYRGKPLIVGGSPSRRGVVSTCSYEARKYGVHSAMASALAIKLCPHAIFVRGRFEAYREASSQINMIFHEFTDLVEPVSIDEAYLDVTVNKFSEPSATKLAKLIRAKIFATTKLTASAGVSYNKFLAKIASEMNKPDGLFVITPDNALQVLESLPIGKFHGIGKVSEKKMNNIGIYTGKDLKKWKLKDLIKHFGKAGSYYYYIVRGIDDREVKVQHIRKSIGNENTFSEDINDINEMRSRLRKNAYKIASKLQEKGAKAKTVNLKIKFSNFDIISKSKTIKIAIDKEEIIYLIAENLLLDNIQKNRKVRLLGISVSNLEWNNEKRYRQMLFPFFEEYPIVNVWQK